ncbi:hypothetical protein M378DRAFT_28850 [Amanita muscaria Koide BX008]|uniref:Uncharacterized protein n=1 Tax=Amanita muscaria (strain Koide BX008) TaxID=946122 RepID=A0A0C2WB80_AMAMK|nr:hypothetical protein M378DRAFT_28850 [Amanita muscaria Koide BX008]
MGWQPLFPIIRWLDFDQMPTACISYALEMIDAVPTDHGLQLLLRLFAEYCRYLQVRPSKSFEIVSLFHDREPADFLDLFLSPQTGHAGTSGARGSGHSFPSQFVVPYQNSERDNHLNVRTIGWW